jgi:hypothetical protein
MEEAKEQVKSSAARTGLAKLVRQVLETHQDVLIEQNGEIVARLTVRQPRSHFAGLRMRMLEAREGWSKLLESVILGAKWFFLLKLDPDTPVYLVRHEAHKNEFFQRYRAEAQKVRQKKDVSTAADALRDVQAEMAALRESALGGIDGVEQKITCLFALMNRGGDLLATPESGVVPIRTADDLDRF